MSIAAIVPAAGYGSFDDGVTSKLSMKVGGVPILCRVVQSVKRSGLSPLIVVLNTKFGDQLLRQLWQFGHKDVRVEWQDSRRGVAHATLIGTGALPINVQNFVVVLGEMLFLTHQTLSWFTYGHLELGGAMTFLSSTYDSADSLCKHLASRSYMVDGVRPLGSVYGMQRDWFSRVYIDIPPSESTDEYGPEYRLTSLISGRKIFPAGKIVELSAYIPEEILTWHHPDADRIWVHRVASLLKYREQV